jgi:propionyl-CoA carboxylase alpha chain
VESRIYAEDPYRNFLPSVGRLIRYRPPAEEKHDGVTVRNDTGVYEGGEISIHYDPMIAKLVTHAPTRAAAIDAQAAALDEFYVDGLQHNIPFLAALMAHPRWRAGKLSTGFIAEEFPKGFHGRDLTDADTRVLTAVAAAIDHVAGVRKRQISGQLTGRMVTRERDRCVVLETVAGSAVSAPSEHPLTVTAEGDAIAVRFGGGDALILRSAWQPGERLWRGCVGNEEVAVQVRPRPNAFDLAWRGFAVRAHVYTETEAAAARLMPVKIAADSGKKLLCPMPGLVVSIAVSEGQEVKAGETLAVVEAMKMENVLRAEYDGTVKAVRAKPGETLAVDAVILEFA